MPMAFGCVTSRSCDRGPATTNEVEIDIPFRAGGSPETPEIPDIRLERGTRPGSAPIRIADIDDAVARIGSGGVRCRRGLASPGEEMAEAA